MEKLQQFKARLVQRPDSEHEQAALRIVIVGLVLAYMALFHGSPSVWSRSDWTIVLGLSGFLAIAIAIFVAICLSPSKNVPRRLLGMVADNGGATWYMCLAGEYGFSMIGVFLFVTFGNGFRYGRRYLFGSQVLSLLGFTAVLLLVTYWQDHRSAGVGLLIAMIVLPLYISTLLERIQEARSKAEEANLAKTSFLANMSHEMRTPLNGIVGVVDLLNTTTLSGQQTELVGLLRHSISVLRSLVDDVLDITKIEAGRLTIEVAPFDLHVCINGLIKLLRPHAQAKGLALTAFVDPALEYRLRGDSHHMRQILLNLIGNAIKFTEQGEVTLKVGLKQESPDGVTAHFEVRDTGIGIASESLPKIFERFVQADQSTTRKYGGTGLGTTIAKQLVELMGGNIGVESRLGEGSMFWLDLPLLKERTAPSIEAVQSEAHIAAGGITTLVVSEPSRSASIAKAVRSVGERVDVITPGTAIGARIEQLKDAGVQLRAIVAACHVEQACAAFNAALQRLPDRRLALVYLANADLSVVDRARVGSINGAYVLSEANPRLIANAIHAVTAGLEADVNSSADLGHVLSHERAQLRILVAEDNSTNQKIIQSLLESAGHSVLLASDGEDALDIYESERPDLAILDFNMPQRTGVEVIQAIRVMEGPDEHLPAVILSASVTLESRERALAAGADEFVGKPFDASAFVLQIDRLYERLAQRTATRNPRIFRPSIGELAAQNPARTPELSTSFGTLLDRDRLRQLEDISQDSSFLSELVQGFIGDVQSIIEKTRIAISADEAAAIPDLMHSLKGAAVGIGARKLAELALDLDKKVHSLSVKEKQARLADIETCFGSTSICLNQYLRSQFHH
jgi:two-component system, sensor histidine kinase RpfC